RRLELAGRDLFDILTGHVERDPWMDGGGRRPSAAEVSAAPCLTAFRPSLPPDCTHCKRGTRRTARSHTRTQPVTHAPGMTMIRAHAALVRRCRKAALPVTRRCAGTCSHS